MTLSLYTTYRAWRRDVAAERGAAARAGWALGPIQHAIAQLGMGLAGIGCGGDASVNEANRRRG